MARFGHGTRKMAQQAQSREKILAKLAEGGLTEAVEQEHVKKLRFPSPGTLPPPILQVAGVTFAYPGRPNLYEKIDFAVGLDSRIAMLGPNGAGKVREGASDRQRQRRRPGKCALNVLVCGHTLTAPRWVLVDSSCTQHCDTSPQPGRSRIPVRMPSHAAAVSTRGCTALLCVSHPPPTSPQTTFLKLLAGDLIPSAGAVRPNQHLRIARFTQHAVDSLDLTATPLAYFSSLSPDSTINEVRARLGRYGIGGAEQSQVMATLSDGLKSRVVLALMAHRSPHILLLDEPTNNLDIMSIDALAEGINAFEGGVVLVSHDMRLISQVAKEIFEVDKGKVTRVSLDIMAYKRAVALRLERAADTFERERRARAAAGAK